MDIFRIVLAKYSDMLVASGRAARWNSKGRAAIYAAESRSLACLENIVHRSGAALSQDFRTMVIRVPDNLRVETLHLPNLSPDWRSTMDLRPCQRLGDAWSTKMTGAVLRVPSVIIPEEFNFLLNPMHPDFGAINVVDVLPFLFDPRVTVGDKP